MPKRKQEDKIRYYESKIQELREKQQPAPPVKRRRCIVYSDSSSDEDSDRDTKMLPKEISPEGEMYAELSPEPTNTDIPVQETDQTEIIDVDFLTALGDLTIDTPIYGEKILENLAQRWLPILRRGIPKDIKETLLKEQKIPENCKLLRAPVLNPEISVALIESTRSRDKKIENQQQQLGLGITAINRAMNIRVSGSEDKQTKVQAVKILSDACRILSDLHYMETKSRINLITPALDKSFTAITQDMERDESLFGSKLSDKIKSSKVIEKQGLQIKKATGFQKFPAPSTSQPAPTIRNRYQGNWTAPSRFQSPSNRGRCSEDSRNDEKVTEHSGILYEKQPQQQAACTSSSVNAVCHAGRLHYYFDCWLKITDNPVILKWIKDGFSIPFETKVVQTRVPLNNFSPSENLDMAAAIDKLLELGAINRCQPCKKKDMCKDEFISIFFLIPKANGSKRFILNLKPLNRFISNIHFKMEDYRTASKLIPENGFMATIDLKEAYLLLPMSTNDRKHLRFQFQEADGTISLYEFSALPYGISVALRTFTKLMREVVTHLRSRGFTSVIYLDDILCIGKNYQECVKNVRETINLLRCLGFIINYEKSSLQPMQSCKFLGFVYNSNNMTISLPEEKRDNIAQLIKKFKSLPRCSIRDFAQLIGTLTAACPAVRYGWLYTKLLERYKFLALKKYISFDAKFKPSTNILPDLDWLAKNIQTTCNLIGSPDFCIEIFTDASRTGWGAYSNHKRANGGWTASEKTFHINYLELLTIFLSLKCLARDKSDCAILLRVNNTTAISYINRMGGIQFPHLNELAKKIWQWCEVRKIWLFASYINTKENIEADKESRKITNPDIEWSLTSKVYKDIVNYLGTPEIDLFASRTNAKCDMYISWRPDPDAIAVDAFTLNWNQWFFYAFPPYLLILKCLHKIMKDKAKGILIFPFWPSQAWFPLLKSMMTLDIIFLSNEALPQSRYRVHRQQATLAAARLSGTRFLEEEPLRPH